MRIRNVLYKMITLVLLMTITLLSGCSGCSMKRATFTNTTPAIIDIADTRYLLTEEIIASEELGKQIGKITKINAIVSYLEANNPYRNPNKIKKIKKVEIEKSVAVQINGKYYKANRKE